MPRPPGNNKHQKKPAPIQIRIGRLVFDSLLCFLAFTVVPVLVYSVVDLPTTPLMWIRWMESGYPSERPRFLNHWIPLEDIPPHLIRAVVTAEDQKFFYHRGFDWVAIEYAFKHNLQSKKTLGASTLSMQTARNAFLWQGRTWLRKSLEAYFTFLLEAFWSKKRILEVYLNIIEWGDGVFGIAQASRTYFKHPAGNLLPAESAWLAAILPNPRKWSQPQTGRFIRGRQARILKIMWRLRLPENF